MSLQSTKEFLREAIRPAGQHFDVSDTEVIKAAVALGCPTDMNVAFMQLIDSVADDSVQYTAREAERDRFSQLVLEWLTHEQCTPALGCDLFHKLQVCSQHQWVVGVGRLTYTGFNERVAPKVASLGLTESIQLVEGLTNQPSDKSAHQHHALAILHVLKSSLHNWDERLRVMLVSVQSPGLCTDIHQSDLSFWRSAASLQKEQLDARWLRQ